ncbi:hypothetical protein [Streptomyces sp. SudanB5_2050]
MIAALTLIPAVLIALHQRRRTAAALARAGTDTDATTITKKAAK